MTNLVSQVQQIVLLTIMPYVSTFCEKVGLPVLLPVTTNQVARCDFYPWVDGTLTVGVKLTNGFAFRFHRGHVDSFTASNDYAIAQDPKRIPAYFGPVNMTRREAIKFARDCLLRLGYSLELLYADLDPDVSNPIEFKDGIIPFYSVGWPMPNGPGDSVRIDIDAEHKQVVGLTMFNENACFISPRILPPPGSIRPQPQIGRELSGEELSHGLSNSLRQIGGFGANLGLLGNPVLATNDLSEISVRELHGIVWVRGRLKRNGYRFDFKNGYEMAFWAPDIFYSPVQVVLLNDYAGTSRMSDADMIALARTTIKKIGLNPRILKGGKGVLITRPNIQQPSIPRFVLTWKLENESWIRLEIESEHGVVKALGVVGAGLLAEMREKLDKK